ncbi:MAG: hypothetical protein A2V64_05745 [Bacteroidetes bacterium RBG_13_43_22]|nr:MAG: hypothetical protein A2V64_05745 [Bacteroidetes bacterium RBG_13_43_22]
MKRKLLFIGAFLICSALNAQINPIDELFNKYSEREGFTYVSISGRMLSLIGSLDAEDNPDNLMLRLKSIKILTENDSLSTNKVNFMLELKKNFNVSAYDELMVVKEGRDETLFLIKQNGDRISELLVISGGSGGNSLISIKGDINLKELSELSRKTGIEELEDLEDLKDKPR